MVLYAEKPEAGTWLAMNTITLSQHGEINSLLAGGDIDGDLNMATQLQISNNKVQSE